MKFQATTAYETEVVQARMEAGEYELGGIAIHRYTITSGVGSVLVFNETNDNNDDGYPDGRWDTWTEEFTTVEKALKHTGKCHVGISGVICTVILDGKEVR
jgi:hypothetical protein